MPRLAHGMERCVFFAFGTNYKDGSSRGPGGTGFFIFRESENAPLTFHIYAVTNRHVAAEYPNIRINSSETSVQYWEYDPSDWVLSRTDDLAALDVTDQIEFSEDRGIPYQRPIDFVSERAFVSEKFGHDHHVGVGDETVMLGLLTQHDGGKVNLPVARFGNIAAVPNSLTPVQLSRRDGFVRPAWLNDCRSRGGFSGSPVWIWRSQFDDMNLYNGPGLPASLFAKNQPATYSFLALLGCHRGQFYEETTIYAKGESSRPERPLRSGDDIELASAMTVVVPAWEISNLLDYSQLKDQRDARDKRPERRRYSEEALKIIRTQNPAGILTGSV
jgi:hypothetical protein